MGFHNFLLLRSGAIGDIIHTLPFVNILAKSCKNKKITYAMSPYLAPLMVYAKGIDHILPIDLHTGLKGLWEKANFLKENSQFGRFTDFINLQPHWKTQIISYLLKTERVFLYQKQKQNTEEKHAWQNFALSYFHEKDLNLVNFDLADQLPLIELPLNIIIEKTHFMNPMKTNIAFILGVGKHRPHRAWTIKNWLQLIKLIDCNEEEKPDIILIGGNEEKDLSLELMSLIPTFCKVKVINAIGAPDLISTACILSKCKLAIGGDTGPTHLAGALGIYTIGLFGPTSPIRHAPFYGMTIKSPLSCPKACTQKKCTRKVLNCLESITPDQVWLSLHNFLYL